MDDFSVPGAPNFFGLAPSPLNYPQVFEVAYDHVEIRSETLTELIPTQKSSAYLRIVTTTVTSNFLTISVKSIYLTSHYSSSHLILVLISSILHYYSGIQAPIVLYVTFLCADPKWCHKAYWGRVRGTKNNNCHSPGPLEHILCRHAMLLLFPIIFYIFIIFFPIFHSSKS